MLTASIPLVYDAVTVSRILGLPCECNDPVPPARDGEIVVYYGGWSLTQLRRCSGSTERTLKQAWYKTYEWPALSGYYRLLLPVPRSNFRHWDAQLHHLATIDAAWTPAPVRVAATALIVHFIDTGEDLLRGGRCRCAEALPGNWHPEIGVYAGHVCVRRRWDFFPGKRLWLAAAKKCPNGNRLTPYITP